ncbi:MAG: O-antigen ligase family protein [Flavobacteriales bacterium]|nr:O-antigen ligase family protein [Flavobacteriales bacterium]
MRLPYFAVIHVLLGFFIAQQPSLSFEVGLAIIFFALGHILLTGNAENQAALWASYIVGIEILLRMTGGYLVWEAGKYSVSIILLTGMLVQRNPIRWPRPIVWYGLLLLPSFAVVNFPDFESFRTGVSFNLSGPLTLFISSVYFYQRPLAFNFLLRIFQIMAIPLISVLVYLTIITPELSEIEYGTQSNFTASAGFGPNQVATVMGLGFFVLGLLLYFGNTVTGFFWMDLIFMLFLLIRGLATFSRGGMIGGVLALTLLIVLSIVLAKRVISWYKLTTYSIVAGSVILFSWNYVDRVSDNRLTYRYQGIDYRTGMKKDITSHRLEILEHEMQLFTDNLLLGIGPGMIRETALKENFIANTHSEFSRTLAEHGLFGLLALLIMIVFPVRYIGFKPKAIRPVWYAILFFVFFTMFHSAMRLAMPGFIYGLVFFNPLNTKRQLV